MYQVGVIYKAVLNGRATKFEVLEVDKEASECQIMWEEGEVEWAYILDMDRWTAESDDEMPLLIV